MSGQNENINNNLKNIQEEEHLITFQDIVKDKEIKTYLEPLVDGYVAADVTFSTERTLYSCVGDLIVWLSFAFLAVTAVIEIAAKIKTIRRKD